MIFCDEEGERVAAVSAEAEVDPFDLDLRGAAFASLLAQLRAGEWCAGPLRHLRLRCALADEVVWVQGLKEGYYLVVVCARAWDASRVLPLLDDIAEGLCEQI